MLSGKPSSRAKLENAWETFEEREAFYIPESEVFSIEALKLAQPKDRSACDTAYLALAKAENAPLITADKRLDNALKGKFSPPLTVKRNPNLETLGGAFAI